MDPVSDETLLKQFADGRSASLGDLAQRYEAPLLGLARGLLRGRDDLARDAVQETWVRVIRFAESFNGNSGVKTWLYRIAINQCRDLAALAAKHSTRTEAAAHTAGDSKENTAVDAGAIETERDDQIRAAVSTLDFDKREILLLCYHEGLTHNDAARTLGIPVGTLKSRLHAALAELRERLNREML